MTITPPIAKKVALERTHHGDTFIDNYEWLRAKEDPEVIAYLEAENAYTEQQTAGLEALRGKIFDEIKSRTQETDLSVPTRMGQWWYYSRTVEGKSYGLQCRCPVDSPDDWTPPTLSSDVDVPGEQILLDANVEAEGHDFFSLGAFSISLDGTLLAYSTDTEGDERYTLRFKNLETGELLADTIENVAPGATWTADATHVFYLTVDESWRPDTVWRHTLGKSEDVQVFHEPDESYWVGFGSTRSEKYLMIWVGSKITSECLVLESTDPEGEFRVVLPRTDGIEYSIEHAVVAGEDRFLITHNGSVNGWGTEGEKAENFLLAEAPVSDPLDQRILVPHQSDVRVEDIDAFASHLIFTYRREALTRMAIWPLTDEGYGEYRELEFDEELYSVGAGSNPEWDQPLLRMVYTSFITPGQVYDLDIASGELLLRKSQPVLGEFDAGDYVQHREWATAPDGTQIPLSVIARKDVPEGPAPTLLYGYGSYEASMDPSFSVARLSLLDRGIVFVVAHVRGGGEMGRHWYDQGKTLQKKNTFTDFIAAAQHLIDTGRTSPKHLVADGGSAG
ncbi:MAG: S9 family peptidase, partial [Rhodococcus sp. (in: high G+C Gram-positive bacteria)]